MIEGQLPGRSPKTAAWAVAIALAAAGLRLAAARGDLVLDEIWSLLGFANPQTSSPMQILATAHDNNHILNTLVMYALGQQASSLAYRLPAVAAASAGLWFGYLVARRRGAEIPVLILLGLSHVLILYASEARGYAYLTGCTLAAWWALENYLDRPQNGWRAVFTLASTLGFLAQLPFAFAYAGFFVYSALRLWPRRRGLTLLMLLHAWTFVAVVLIWIFYIDGLQHGGGDRLALGDTLVATFALMAGGPQTGTAALVAAGIAALLVIVSLVAEFRADFARGALFLTAMFVAPAAVIAISGFDIVYPRHFLVPMIFGCVAVGSQCARWWQQGQARRWAVALLLAGFVGCNAVPVARLIAGGRSQDRAVLFWIAKQTPGPVVTISGDHDFRVEMVMMWFHGSRNEAHFRSLGKSLKYVPKDAERQEAGAGLAEGTEWRLLHSSSEWQAPPAAQIKDERGNRYELVKTFPCSSISGWTWWVYHRSM